MTIPWSCIVFQVVVSRASACFACWEHSSSRHGKILPRPMNHQRSCWLCRSSSKSEWSKHLIIRRASGSNIMFCASWIFGRARNGPRHCICIRTHSRAADSRATACRIAQFPKSAVLGFDLHVQSHAQQIGWNCIFGPKSSKRRETANRLRTNQQRVALIGFLVVHPLDS